MRQCTILGYISSKQCHLALLQNVYSYHRQKIYDILSYHYADWDRPRTDRQAIRDSVSELIGDGQYAAPAVQLARHHSALHHPVAGATFLVSFGDPSGTESVHASRFGATGWIHGEDLAYVMGAPMTDGISPFEGTYTRTQKSLCEVVMKYWTNFIKYG